MPNAQEFHAIVSDLSVALKAIQENTAALVAKSRAGEIVDPMDVVELHNLVAEAQSLATNNVQPPQGDPVPDTGDAPPAGPGPVFNTDTGAPAAEVVTTEGEKPANLGDLPAPPE